MLRPIRFFSQDSLEFIENQWTLAPWDRAELDQSKQCMKWKWKRDTAEIT